MTKRNNVAGSMSLHAALKYSRWILPRILKGIMISNMITCGVQYQGLRNSIKVSPNAIDNLVKGFRL
jgi:hypothetical protein